MENTRGYFSREYARFDSNLPKECGNCLSKENLCIHHIVPLGIGGTNRFSNLVRLCEDCHNKVHGKKMNMHELARVSIEKAKRDGVKFGRKRENEAMYADSVKEYVNGVPLLKLQEKYPALRVATFYRRLKEYRSSKEEAAEGEVLK